MEQKQFDKITVGKVDGENLIFDESWRNQILLLLALIATFAGTLYATIEFPTFAVAKIPYQDGIISIPFLFLIPLIIFIRYIFVICNERLVLTPDYMILITGRISWRATSNRLEYSKIQEIEISHTLFQRFMRVGDLVIRPMAGSSDTHFCMHGIYKPREVKDAIRRLQGRG